MLEMKISAKECHVEVGQVTLLELLAELGMGIQGIYSQIYHANPACAAEFKIGLLSLVGPDSPVWNPESKGVGIAMIIPTPRKE